MPFLPHSQLVAALVVAFVAGMIFAALVLGGFLIHIKWNASDGSVAVSLAGSIDQVARWRCGDGDGPRDGVSKPACESPDFHVKFAASDTPWVFISSTGKAHVKQDCCGAAHHRFKPCSKCVVKK